MSKSYTSLSFPTALTLIFIVLKLLNKITRSWWLVLSPIWIGIGITVAIFVVWLIIMFIKEVVG